jgi:hypothetical protein
VFIPPFNNIVSISHGLQRPYLGWFCTRSLGASFNGFEAPLLSGQTPDRVLRLNSPNACTCDFFIF